MNYDLLLSWASERGCGSLTSFRRAHDWLAAESAADTRQPHWTWALQSFQSLGHIEVSWPDRRWEVAPPTIATMAHGGGYAFLCGARPAWLLRRIQTLDEDPEMSDLAQSIVLERPIPQEEGPALQLLTLEFDRDIESLCTALGVSFAAQAGDRLLAVLPPLSAILQVGRRNELPGGVFPTRMSESRPGAPLFDEVVEDLTPPPGGYCTRLYDVSRHFYVHTSGDIFEASRGDVVYAELRRQGRHVLRWSEPDLSLLMPARMRLPELYERAAVLRTGLLPLVGQRAEDGRALWLTYRNVDLDFARRLAEGLGQHVEVVESRVAAPKQSSRPTDRSPAPPGAQRQPSLTPAFRNWREHQPCS